MVPDGVRALESVKDGRASLLVLDVMLPGLDGLQVSTRLREEGSELPILMVTARVAENDLLLGLDHGADDYLTKPYSPRELLARVRALLRRSAPRRVDGVLRAGAIALDPARRETRSSGRLVDLTRAEFDLLRALMSAAGSVLSRGQLLVALHGDGRFITERTIDAHVKNLRAKLELDPEAPGGIETVYGVGYRFSSTGETGPRASKSARPLPRDRHRHRDPIDRGHDVDRLDGVTRRDAVQIDRDARIDQDIVAAVRSWAGREQIWSMGATELDRLGDRFHRRLVLLGVTRRPSATPTRRSLCPSCPAAGRPALRLRGHAEPDQHDGRGRDGSR